MQFYGPDSEDGRWNDEPSVPLRDVVKDTFTERWVATGLPMFVACTLVPDTLEIDFVNMHLTLLTPYESLCGNMTISTTGYLRMARWC